jgi:hypothetical protein
VEVHGATSKKKQSVDFDRLESICPPCAKLNGETQQDGGFEDESDSTKLGQLPWD